MASIYTHRDSNIRKTWFMLASFLVIVIGIGWVFAQSGWGKLHNLPQIEAYFRSLQIPNPEFQARFVAGTEFVCGVLLVIGLFTRVASIPLTIVMIVAILTAKMAEVKGIIDLFGLDEFLFILVFAYLIVSGPGWISVDRMIVGKRK